MICPLMPLWRWLFRPRKNPLDGTRLWDNS